MKKLLSVILAISLFSNVAMADCDFSTGVVKQADGSFLYTKDCHIAVGKMKQDLDVANKQVDLLNKAIELKDLAMSKSTERLNLWMDTSYKLEDRMNKIDQLERKNQWLFFGLGVVTTAAAVWGAGQLAHK